MKAHDLEYGSKSTIILPENGSIKRKPKEDIMSIVSLGVGISLGIKMSKKFVSRKK